MTFDQIFLLVLLAAVLGLFVWGRLRHDIVAMLALITAAVGGQVAPDSVFAGFANPATVTVVLVLIASRGLFISGAVNLLARKLLPPVRSTSAHVGVLSGVAGAMSSFMNNVGALALLMPATLHSAKQAGRSPSVLLMPLAYGSILGGLVTLIGTPPNIIVASIRGEMRGTPFALFDFAPVGGVVAVLGIAFVALIGWRLIPRAGRQTAADEDLLDIGDYVTEAKVPPDHELCGKTLREIDELVAEKDAIILGLLRGARRIDPAARRTLIRGNDVLLIEAGPDAVNAVLTALDLRPPTPPSEDDGDDIDDDETEKSDKPSGNDRRKLFSGPDVAIAEAVVRPGAQITGRTMLQLGLRSRFGVNLLAVARQGRQIHSGLRSLRFRAGDVLLLEGDPERLPAAISSLGCLPLAEREIPGSQFHLAWLAIGLFAAAIAATTLNLLSFPVALSIAVVAMVLTNIMPVRELYSGVDWSVVVLLGAMIPVGQAMQATGTTAVIADAMSGLLAGHSPVIALIVVLVVTMTLSDIINNAATAVVMAPIGIGIAERLTVNPDSFLMAVAIGASCAFLTPIGHQNNALVMGPGGYRFGDYWRMGLPLEILIVAVAIPMLLWVWPLA